LSFAPNITEEALDAVKALHYKIQPKWHIDAAIYLIFRIEELMNGKNDYVCITHVEFLSINGLIHYRSVRNSLIANGVIQVRPNRNGQIGYLKAVRIAPEYLTGQRVHYVITDAKQTNRIKRIHTADWRANFIASHQTKEKNNVHF